MHACAVKWDNEKAPEKPGRFVSLSFMDLRMRVPDLPME